MGKKNNGGASNLGRQLIKDRFGHTPRRKVDNDTMVRSPVGRVQSVRICII